MVFQSYLSKNQNQNFYTESEYLSSRLNRKPNLYLRQLTKQSSPIRNEVNYCLTYNQGTSSSLYKSKIVESSIFMKMFPIYRLLARLEEFYLYLLCQTVLPRLPHRIPYDHNSPVTLRQRTIPRTKSLLPSSIKGPQ